MSGIFTGTIRDDNPCKDCPDKDQRPACRKGCKKDADWHKELERVKQNKREYERREGVRYKKRGEYGGMK